MEQGRRLQTEALLRKRLSGGFAKMPKPAPSSVTPQPSYRLDEAEYSDHYGCARRQYSLRHDGDQRSMTRLEEKALNLWLA